MVLRKIIKIDEEKCTGCGLCVPKCAEGALQIIDGKARLVSDRYCDGLGACLGECPVGALQIIEREAEPFEETLTQPRETASGTGKGAGANGIPTGGCPGTRMRFFPGRGRKPAGENGPTVGSGEIGAADVLPSALQQWPVQLALVSPHAPYFQGAHLVVAADCVPFAFADFHWRFLAGKALVIACPKLDETGPYVQKLTALLKQNSLKGITVVHMEVPCCSGLLRLVQTARNLAEVEVPIEEITISIEGEILPSKAN